MRSNWKVYCQEMESSVAAISEAKMMPGLTSSPQFCIHPSDGGGGGMEEREKVRGVEELKEVTEVKEGVISNEREEDEGTTMTTNKILKADEKTLKKEGITGGLINEKVTTHFERKYLQVGLKIYEYNSDLGYRTAEQRRSMLDNIAPQ